MQNLKADEEEKIREIEELFSYEELIELRTKSLDEVRAEACQQYPYRYMTPNPTNGEIPSSNPTKADIEKYFEECYSHLFERKLAKETSSPPPSTDRFNELKHSIQISFDIEKLVFF